MAEIAAAIPPEVADLRPEDLRVEAEFFSSLTRTAPNAQRAPSPAPESPAPLGPSPTIEDFPPKQLSELLEPSRALSRSLVIEAAELVPPEAKAVPAPEEARPVVPPIEVEQPRILPPGSEIRTTREVVLPASVVVAWSIFVLLSVAFSFIAGLMVGHYLWKL
jgi:hypothetical protein